MDTTVVFIENEDKHANLVYSLSKLNIPYVHLHRGKPWVSMLNKLQIYIGGLSAMDNEWVILSDARDVLFYKSLETINAVYEKHYSDYDIVIQAEDTPGGCEFFRKTKLERLSKFDTHYKYPCSGLMMGRRERIIEFLTAATSKPHSSWLVADQPAVEWVLYFHPEFNATLDTKCRLFQQMGTRDYAGVNFHLHFNRKFIRNTHTNTEPCIFHGAGNSFLHPVWKIIKGLY